MRPGFIVAVSVPFFATLALCAFILVPILLEKQTDIQACHAVVEEIRRQNMLPPETNFRPCERTVTFEKDGDWLVFGRYDMPSLKEPGVQRFVYYGTAWRSGNEWEAALITYNAVPPRLNFRR